MSDVVPENRDDASDTEQFDEDLNTTATISKSEKIGTFSSFRFRNFRYLLTGTVLSNAGQWIQQVTLSWLVYDITSSGTMLGTVNLVRSIASLSMIPFAGLLIDRINRRRLMALTNGCLFIITLGFGLLLLLGGYGISYIFIFSFIGGLIQTTDGNLRQVIVFDVVPRSHAPNAVAMVQTGWSLMRSFGPGIGGFLILWFGPGGNFLVQAGAYLLIVITIMQIRLPARGYERATGSPVQNVKEGIKYIAKEKLTRTFMMMGFTLPLFIIPIFSILPPIYAVEVFKGEADILGILMSSIGVGGIVGGFVTASLGRFRRRGLIQLGALFLLSITLIAFAFATALPVALMLFALAGFFEVIFLATNQTLLQLSIPDHLRGRVTSVVNLNAVLMPLGGLIAGIGSDLIGPRMITVAMCSSLALITVGIFLFSPTVRNYRLGQDAVS